MKCKMCGDTHNIQTVDVDIEKINLCQACWTACIVLFRSEMNLADLKKYLTMNKEVSDEKRC
jgi:ribosome-binding protein aMBF1 (putative translation factor)